MLSRNTWFFTWYEMFLVQFTNILSYFYCIPQRVNLLSRSMLRRVLVVKLQKVKIFGIYTSEIQICICSLTFLDIVIADQLILIDDTGYGSCGSSSTDIVYSSCDEHSLLSSNIYQNMTPGIGTSLLNQLQFTKSLYLFNSNLFQGCT